MTSLHVMNPLENSTVHSGCHFCHPLPLFSPFIRILAKFLPLCSPKYHRKNLCYFVKEIFKFKSWPHYLLVTQPWASCFNVPVSWILHLESAHQMVFKCIRELSPQPSQNVLFLPIIQLVVLNLGPILKPTFLFLSFPFLSLSFSRPSCPWTHSPPAFQITGMYVPPRPAQGAFKWYQYKRFPSLDWDGTLKR
jgi:hypothetical protein